jgi:uncharacterized protein
LITGASAGIGAMFARKLAERGYDLVLVARREDRLIELGQKLESKHGIVCRTLAVDLAEDEGVRRAEEIITADEALALVVNNAGFGTRGLLAETQPEAQQQMHRVHVLATMRLTQAALRGMVQRGRGGVINVSSVAGFMQTPGNVSYCSTKAWIRSFTEGTAMELKMAGSPVKVQALCPGFTYTEFHDVMGVSRDQMPKSWWMSADDVVEESLAGLETGKLFVIPGWRYKLFVAVFTRLPLGARLALEQRAAHRKDV